MDRKASVWRRALGLALSLALAGAAAAQAAAPGELIEAGRLLYTQGRLASGGVVTALVQGDVPVDGTQMTCRSCHGRSGMGTIEGGRIPAALAGPMLFAAEPQRRRPAYTESSLARALRDGVDAAGRPLDPLMPRFRLGDRDVAALAAYLRQLGTEPSPGIGPSSLRIATVIAGEVDREVERAMLDVLEAYVAARNRSGPQRLRGGRFPDQWKEIYREWTLDVWRLDGDPASWRAQLEKRYAAQPAFAIVGGIASRAWQPIHDFCESKRMPCVLPDTDLPPSVEGGFYSLYYSGGLRQEAEIIADTLRADGLHTDAVAVTEGKRDSPSSQAAAALARAIERRGGRLRTVRGGRLADPTATVAEVFATRASAVVLWMNAEGLRRMAEPLAGRSSLPPLFLSSTLVGQGWQDLPATLRDGARIVHLYALPGARDSALQRFRVWARMRGVRMREERHQALAYFACLTLAEGAKHMAFYISRDYFLDLLEHSSILTTYLPLFDRAALTPGQRVLSRGGYLVDLSGRRKPAWLVP